MDIETEIIKKEDVLDLIEDKLFIKKWQELANLNDKTTIHLEPNYVLTWYSIYKNKFDLVFVIEYCNDNELAGLIPLALSKNRKIITHAGYNQSTYHGWLYSGEREEEFMMNALVKIKEEFDVQKWNWGWIPANSNLSWLNNEKLIEENIYTSFIHENSPIIDFLKDDERIEKLRKSKTIRNQLNRLKKRENFHLEKITSKERLAEVFDVLENQCNFRQMAANKVIPFVDDPLKRTFQIEKLKHLNYNHFTILWANNKVVAFNLGEINGDTVIMGIMAYDPLEGKNSPGKIFILELVELLKKEGIKYFDMTPGGDLYKRNFSDSFQKVIYLTIYFDKKAKTQYVRKKKIKESAKNSLKSIGLSPEFFQKNISPLFLKITSVRNYNVVDIVKKIGIFFYKKNSIKFYKHNDKNISENDLISDDKINNYTDLFLHETKDREEKSIVVSHAMYQFNRGNILYSSLKDGVLDHYFWLTRKNGVYKLPEVNTEFKLPENSTMLFDFYSRSRFNENNQFIENIQNVLRENIATKFQTLIKVDHENLAFEEQLKKLGFETYKVFSLKRILWFNLKKAY